jgi:CPA1 family monovalent cation:H+ antiporter
MSEALAVLEISELLILLLIASAVAIATKYIKFPYTSALVLVGLAVGTANLVPDLELSEELVFFVFLPPLLFEGALRMDVEHLRENLKPILLYAVPGVLISTMVVGFIIHKTIGIDLSLALLFGAMISPTDPVSVLAAFKKLGVPIELSTLIEGESVFNDGTGIVIFGILLGMVNTGVLSLTAGITKFLFVVIGGGLVGLVLGFVAFTAFKYIDDHLIEVTVTLILAFSVFILAERLHTSGVIGVVVAGLIMGNYGRVMSMSATTRVALTTFWDLAVFMINSFVFIMIGNEIHLDILTTHFTEIGVAVFAVLLGRALSVYPLSLIYNYWADKKIPLNWQHTSFWGGLHGSIPVALALGLSRNLPNRDLIIALTFGVVFFSLVIQGLSFERIVPLFKLKSDSTGKIEYEKKLAESIAIKAAVKELEEMDENREVSYGVISALVSSYQDRKEGLVERLKQIVEESEEIREREYNLAKKRALLAKKSAVASAIRKGIIGEEAGTSLIKEIDEKLDTILSNNHE